MQINKNIQGQGSSSGQHSLRPKKSHKTKKHRTLHTLKKDKARTLTLQAASQVPVGERLHDWHAVNLLDFYNDLSLLMGILEDELCTAHTCPTMSAGPKYKYLWADKGGKPEAVCAAVYIEKMMAWVEGQIDDPKLFPIADPDSNSAIHYPTDFELRLRNIFRKLFRAYAHAYHSHFDAFVSLGAESHLNTCFKHFVIYTQEHQLLQDKDTAPLRDFIAMVLAPETGGRSANMVPTLLKEGQHRTCPRQHAAQWQEP